jgi:hypothetical protein
MKRGQTMGKLVEEVRLWNTPVVGAHLLWRFTSGYTEHHANGDAPSALLHFLAMAILTSPQLLEGISGRRPNLQSYARSFAEKGRSDLLLGIQKRVDQKKDYTLAAIDIAVANGLLAWDAERGKLYARTRNTSPGRGCRPKGAMGSTGNKAGLLGKWMSEHDIGTIASYIGVAF